MSSIFQIKRRLDVVGSATPPVGGNNLVGELSAYFPCDTANAPAAADKGKKPVLYLNDGVQWREVNPDVTLAVSNWNISLPTGGWTTLQNDINTLAAPRTIAPGEVVIVSWNDEAFAFTGGAGTWGATGAASPGTVVTAGMFVSLGSSATVENPAVVSFDAVPAAIAPAIAGPGAAYAAWNAADTTNNVLGTGLTILSWKGSSYVLTDPSDPGDNNNWQPISQDLTFDVLDWTTGTMGAALSIEAAYSAWRTTAGNPDFTKSVNIVKYGSPAAFYLVVDPANGTVNASYQKISPDAVPALTFRANLDPTAQLPDALPWANWAVGDFAVVASSGTVETNNNANTQNWGDFLIGAGADVVAGDLMLFDGTNFHVLAQDTDLTVYVSKAGDTFNDGAKLTFDTATAAALPTSTPAEIAARAAAMIILDGDGGTIDNVVIDAGSY